MKNYFLLAVALIIGVFQSCDVEIPPSDTTPPEFSFEITGDGINERFDQDTDFSSIQLNLKEGKEFSVIYSAADQGGMKLTQWQLPGDSDIHFLSPIESPWSIRSISQINRMIEWRGNRNSPVSGNIFANRFETGRGNTGITFRFYASDFGGDGGTSNSVSKELSVLITTGDSELITF